MAPRPPIKDLNLFFFDSETGGLSPLTSDMIEVACVVTDPTGQIVQDEYCAKVYPERPVDPGAARINGYTQEKWAAEAITLDAAMVRMLKMAQNTLFTAHNAPFDWGFFEHAMAKRAMRWPSDYHRVDTVALAFPLLRAGMVPNLKLTTLTEDFNIPHDNAHTALSDARACRGVYLKLMERYAPLFEKE
jgi:DNA polymerase-3 subunit epsilon